MGSLDQYLTIKEAVTYSLIWRELETLQAVIMAFDAMGGAPAPPTRLIGMAVDQQRRQRALAQLPEAEDDRLAPSGDVSPVRARIAGALSTILGVTGGHDESAIVQDMAPLFATLVNAAALGVERDTAGDTAMVESDSSVRDERRLGAALRVVLKPRQGRRVPAP